MLGKLVVVQFDQQRVLLFDADRKITMEESPVAAVRTNAKGRKTVEAAGADALRATDSQIQRVNPFDHPQMLVHDWEIAGGLLKLLMRKILPKRLLIRPNLLLQPLKNRAGGLTADERERLVQMGHRAGAKKVHILPPDQSAEEAARIIRQKRF
jgi:hypothetical protein